MTTKPSKGAKKPPSPAQALAMRSRAKLRQCAACASPEVRDFVIEYLEACETTKGAAPDIGGLLLDHLHAELGYAYGEAALRRHLRQCPGTREVWARLRRHG